MDTNNTPLKQLPVTHSIGLIRDVRGRLMIEGQRFRTARDGEVPTIFSDKRGLREAERAFEKWNEQMRE